VQLVRAYRVADDEPMREVRAVQMLQSSSQREWNFFIPDQGGFRHDMGGATATIAFVAERVPAFGYASFVIRYTMPPPPVVATPAVARPVAVGNITVTQAPTPPTIAPTPAPPAPARATLFTPDKKDVLDKTSVELGRLQTCAQCALYVIMHDGSVLAREPHTRAWVNHLNWFEDDTEHGTLVSVCVVRDRQHNGACMSSINILAIRIRIR
jgi:hypothetical protein